MEEKNVNPEKDPPINAEKNAMEEEQEEEESLKSEETPRKKFKSIS